MKQSLLEQIENTFKIINLNCFQGIHHGIVSKTLCSLEDGCHLFQRIQNDFLNRRGKEG